jgi:hypothetical protein
MYTHPEIGRVLALQRQRELIESAGHFRPRSVAPRGPGLAARLARLAFKRDRTPCVPPLAGAPDAS